MTRQVVKFATLLPCMSCDLCLFAVTMGEGFSDWSDLFGWQGRWRVALWVRSHCQEIWRFFLILEKESIWAAFCVTGNCGFENGFSSGVLWASKVDFFL